MSIKNDKATKSDAHIAAVDDLSMIGPGGKLEPLPEIRRVPLTEEELEAARIAKEDAEFLNVATDRYMYKAGDCRVPLVGMLLNCLPMPAIKGREWSAYLIRTTRPTQACDRDGNVVNVGIGEEVLIPATYVLAGALGKAATAPDFVFEVSISPSAKIDIGGGQTMWQYKVGAKPHPKRRGAFGLAAVLGASIAALPPGEIGDAPF